MITNIDLTTTLQNNDLQCVYCHRCFHFRDIYDQHVVTCEFFYRGRRNRERMEDDVETLPTPQEQFKLIQHLLYQNTLLQKKVARMESRMLAKKRKIILDCLQNPSYPKPAVTFFEWVKTISVCFDDLDAVFEHDLVSGMIHSLNAQIEKEKEMVSGITIPICAFHQKPGTFYIWELPEENAEACWRILSVNDFDKWMNKMSHRFLQEFTLWKQLNAESMRLTDEGKDKLIEYMRKIMGLGESYEQRRRSELKKWLFEKLAKNFDHMVEVEYL